jgi:hypothetical protein
MVLTVDRTPDGEPFAVVIDSDVRARTSVAPDGSAMTITLSKPGSMPCSLIFPGDVALLAFGPDVIAILAANRSKGTDTGEPPTFIDGNL